MQEEATLIMRRSLLEPLTLVAVHIAPLSRNDREKCVLIRSSVPRRLRDGFA